MMMSVMMTHTMKMVIIGTATKVYSIIERNKKSINIKTPFIQFVIVKRVFFYCTAMIFLLLTKPLIPSVWYLCTHCLCVLVATLYSLMIDFLLMCSLSIIFTIFSLKSTLYWFIGFQFLCIIIIHYVLLCGTYVSHFFVAEHHSLCVFLATLYVRSIWCFDIFSFKIIFTILSLKSKLYWFTTLSTPSCYYTTLLLEREGECVLLFRSSAWLCDDFSFIN
jgi:hypothetical protein